ncbi:MAG: hypothetical protein GY853_12180 [PVC group bacterium]|nr:hypothetical protein [PVC group bacterium]
MQKFLSDFAKEQIRTIHAKSQELNQSRGKDHNQVLFKLVHEHAEEIQQLHAESNPHYIIETGDLLILCLELIKEAGANSDEVMAECYKRYHKKLDFLLKKE